MCDEETDHPTFTEDPTHKPGSVRKRRKIFRKVVQPSNQDIGIAAKQRARMAIYYPHLYSAPAGDLLEALLEEEAAVATADH